MGSLAGFCGPRALLRGGSCTPLARAALGASTCALVAGSLRRGAGSCRGLRLRACAGLGADFRWQGSE
eukprot:6079693-Alexandrium_andersonii.AAC.1